MILGIDPGLTGALAWMTDAGELISIDDMPTEKIKVGKGERNVVAPARLALLIAKQHPVHAFLEKVSTRPGEGAVGAFSFGRGFGCIEGILAGLSISVTYAPPQVWKRALNVPKDKGGARLRAQQMFPAHADLFARVKDDGRAESAMIASWGAAVLQLGRAA
jgi:crossover junction endodeoxyribonuclease RuvC